MADKLRFEPDDLLQEQLITDVHVVPTRPLAVCAIKSINTNSRQYEGPLWTFALDTGEARCFTRGDALVESPRWSHDGKTIAFLADREEPGTPQVHLIPFDGGESRQLTHLARGATAICWRPQGDKLLVVGYATVDPDERAAGCDRQDGAVAEAPDKDAPQVCWRLPYKMDGTGYTLDTRQHLFLIDVQTGASTQLTSGDFDVLSADWSPDGKRLCYCRRRTEAGKEHCSDIWLMELDGDQPGEARRLSFDQANSAAPAWSPDGRWIVFSGSLDEGDAQMRMWLIDVEQARVEPLGDEGIEVMPGDLHWRRDGSEVAFIQVVRGLQHAAAVAVPGGETRAIADGERHIGKLVANDYVVYSSETAASPLALFCNRWEGGEERQLSHFNDWWQDREMPQVEYRRFEVPDGDGGTEQIDGWLLTPGAADATRPGPLLVDVHGGPAAYVQLKFSTHPYWQGLCARGWSVLALNPVGSSSYGRKFSARLRERWGELDLPQHLAAIKQLRCDGLADDCIAITGSSYGGYLSAYAIGHSDLFRVAVVCAPVANMESHFGTSDSGYYADAYSTDGEPDEQRELMGRLSPMTTIEKVRTPTLFLQGADDERCPRGQSEELFVKLRRAGGTPAEMVLYPGGSHHVFGEGKVAHRLDIQHRIVDWLERWIDEPLPEPKSDRQSGGKTDDGK
ncbi:MULTISPECIES: S9 family peptidase [unclassified Roseateles]|uniref:S9 family peptidase n=1 Tax=unclassified Roseateles TaxID=2626991 RepID=UPI0009E81FE1|nr:MULTISPECIES: S9 family peptidase [unclassified Roseateles]